MENDSDLDEVIISVYIRLIRQDSVEAAAAIEKIHAISGSRAALRATLVLTLMKMEIQQDHWLPTLSLYSYLIRGFPEAVPLLEHAIDCCLQAWSVRGLELVHLEMDDPAIVAAKVRTSGPRHS